MTKLSFEEAVAELLVHMQNAGPIDQELVMLKLSRAIETSKQPALKIVPVTDDEDFDNVPL